MKNWDWSQIQKKTKYVCMGEGKEILKFDGGEEIKHVQSVLIQVQKQTSWEIIQQK